MGTRWPDPTHVCGVALCWNDAYLVLSGFPSNYVAGVFILNDEHLVLSPTTSGRPVAKVGSLHAEEPPLIKGPLLYQKGLLFCLSHRFVKKSIIL